MVWEWERGQGVYRRENMHKIQERHKNLLNMDRVAKNVYISFSFNFSFNYYNNTVYFVDVEMEVHRGLARDHIARRW